MNIKSFSLKFFFVVILLVGIFFRFYKLDQYPPSLNWDEISIGYNAYSILKTGKDEWGSFLPSNFRAYGDYKLPLYIYVDVPFVAMIGLNEWGVRFPSALSGVGVVIFIFLIIKKLTKDNTIALWGMGITALIPWLIILSRIALEANLALFLVTAGLYFFITGLEKKQYLIFSAFLFGLSLFTYNSARVIIPPLIILVAILFRKKIKLDHFALITLFIITIFLIFAYPAALLQDSSARYRWTTILDEGAISKINELRGSSALPLGLEKVFYNKVTYFIPQSIVNYVSHFNPIFLFIEGGSNYQYSVPGSGLVYISLLPFFILGIFQIFKKKLDWQFLILGLFLIAPIPGAVTRDAPHALRGLFISIPLVIITVLGIQFLKENLKILYVNFLKMLIGAALFVEVFLFLNNYIGEYSKNYSWSWQYGYKNIFSAEENFAKYDKIFITKKYGEPHEFLLFYLKYDPLKYQSSQTLIRYQRSDWYWVDGFDKYTFVNDWEVIDKVKDEKNSLLITSPGNYPQSARLLQTIYFLNNKPAFDIVKL